MGNHEGYKHRLHLYSDRWRDRQTPGKGNRWQAASHGRGSGGFFEGTHVPGNGIEGERVPLQAPGFRHRRDLGNGGGGDSHQAENLVHGSSPEIMKNRWLSTIIDIQW